MKRGHHHGALRLALLKAGKKLLDHDGIDGIGIRAVARIAEVSHAAPINHFADRRALLTGLAVECFSELRQSLEAALERAAPQPRTRLDAFVDAYVQYGLAHPERYRLIWRTDLLDAADSSLQAHGEALFNQLGELLAAVANRRDIDPMTLHVALASVIHGYMLLRIDQNFEPATDGASGRPRHLAILDAVVGRS